MKKRILSIAMAAMMTMTLLTGCGGQPSGSGSGGGSASGSGAASSESAEPVTLRIGMGTSVPFGYLDENEKPAGFVVDMWEEICSRAGYEADIQYIDGTDAQYAAIDADKIDVLGGQQTIRDAIKDKYNFTVPYGYNEIALVGLNDCPYESIEDLHGLKVCIDAGGKLAEFFNAYNDSLPEGEPKIELVFTEGALVENLRLGRFQAFPWTILSYEKQKREGKADDYRMFGDPIIVEENVFPINKKVPAEVLEKINEVITEMKEDGSLKELSEQWFERDITEPYTVAQEEIATKETDQK